MNTPITWRGIKLHHISMLLALGIASIITACEKNTPHTVAIQQGTKKFLSATVLQGTVSDKNGTVKAGSVELNDAQNRLLLSAVLDNGRYRLEVPENTPLPVILNVSATTGPLLAAVVDPSINTYDINPLTTAIAKKAQALGGYTRANMVVAAESMINAPDANKTSTGFRGDPTTQYGGWH
ncbi:hypothetical protein [Methylovulum miyakonense]|uniref:hypothetical protein n=1 Tax=Methylovulum miyakonense TaxID=645578 RepID=UPI0003751B1A|nr:hypothetical protein [Methylovulum miyakonense]